MKAFMARYFDTPEQGFEYLEKQPKEIQKRFIVADIGGKVFVIDKIQFSKLRASASHGGTK